MYIHIYIYICTYIHTFTRVYAYTGIYMMYYFAVVLNMNHLQFWKVYDFAIL